MADFTETLHRLMDGRDLSEGEMDASLSAILSGEWGEVRTSAFLVAMRQKGVTVGELAAAAGCLMGLCVPVEVESPEEVLDTAGTGGDAKGTFNVSTAASFVAAACGARVAKHGNRAMSGSCGSSDLLAALGVGLDQSPKKLAECLAGTGICFMFAPAHHPALKLVAPVRRELGTRTMFNLLGPLVNPAHAGCRLAGIYDADWLVRYAEALAALGVNRAVVVNSEGMDEFSISGPSRYALLAGGEITEHEAAPADAGLDSHPHEEITVSGIDGAVEAFNSAIDGTNPATRDAAALNAGAALLAAGRADGLAAGVEAALGAIADGRARAKVDEYLRACPA